MCQGWEALWNTELRVGSKTFWEVWTVNHFEAERLLSQKQGCSQVAWHSLACCPPGSHNCRPSWCLETAIRVLGKVWRPRL